eukprot:363474-Chlamydomonas_euryale.AAC.13
MSGELTYWIDFVRSSAACVVLPSLPVCPGKAASRSLVSVALPGCDAWPLQLADPRIVCMCEAQQDRWDQTAGRAQGRAAAPAIWNVSIGRRATTAMFRHVDIQVDVEERDSPFSSS